MEGPGFVGWEVAEMEVPPAAAMIPYGRKYEVLVAVQVLKFSLVIAAVESPLFLAYLSQLLYPLVPL